MEVISENLNSHYFLIVCSRFLTNFLDLGNFFQFLSESNRKKNQIIKKSFESLKLFSNFVCIKKRRKFLTFIRGNRNRFFTEIFFNKLNSAKKSPNQLASQNFFYFYFSHDFFNLIFFKKNKLKFGLKKSSHSDFLIKFLNQLGKKLTIQKKRFLNLGNENLTYLNRISKFQIRQSISRVLSKKSNQIFGLTKKEKDMKDINCRFNKKTENNISMVDISNERLRKIRFLFSIIKTKKLAYSDENFFFTLFLQTESILPVKEIKHFLLVQRELNKKDFSEKKFPISNRPKKKVDIKGSLKETKNIIIIVQEKNKLKMGRKIDNILLKKLIMHQMVDLQINHVHFFCLMLSFFFGKKDKKTNFKYDHGKYFINQKNNPKNPTEDKRIKNSHDSNPKSADDTGKFFLEYFKKQNLSWKFFIFSIKNKTENLNFENKQKLKIKKLGFSIEKLKSVKLSRKEIELNFVKQFKILRENSIKIDLLVLKFSSLKRLFFYQRLMIANFSSRGVGKKEFNEKKKKKIQLKSLEKLTERIRKIKKTIKNQDCRRDTPILKDLKRKLNCPVIDSLPREVILVNCGHLFSSRCVKNLISSRNRTCPLCGTKFSNGSIRSVFFS